MKTVRVLIYCSFTLIFGCGVDEPIIKDIPEFVFAGGETTIFDATSNAYATPAPNLSASNFDKHMAGDLTFEQTFVTSPSQVNAGLGPIFNNNSCVSCHVKNGRGEPSINGDELSSFLIRLSVPGEDENGAPIPVPNFGTQLQNRAIYGEDREAGFIANEVAKIVEFTDGTTTTIYKPEYILTDPYMPLPADLMISPRVAPAVFGLGLLEAISEADLIANSDEHDMDGDGISGKPNLVWDVPSQSHVVGRFGWKAETSTSIQQSAAAYNDDMGITTWIFPNENCYDQPNCFGDDQMIDIDDEILDLTTFYFQSLAVPAVRNYDDSQVLEGKELFNQANCNSCHIPKHMTAEGVIPEVSHQTIFPYTDLLLHDMGDDLADNRPIFEANGKEWRTPPLWGIGLLPVVNGHTRLLHDGRARNISEAILWHGGEAEDSKQAYIEMTQKEREALLSFLNAL